MYKKLEYKGEFKQFIREDDKKYNVLKFSKYTNIFNNILSKFKLNNVLVINFDKINSEETRKKLSNFLDIELHEKNFPKSNSFKSDTTNENYKDIIKSIYGSKLDEDYKDFLNLFEDYEKRFKKIYNL